MSEDATVPAPRAVPRQRSLFGPFVLIFVGVVFLLVNVGALGARNVCSAFARYWPACLILWGLSKLIEHVRARRSGAQAPGLGFGGLLVMILLVLFGSAATAAYQSAGRVNWVGVREE